jgi:hypothetical protein
MTAINQQEQDFEAHEHYTLRFIITKYCQQTALSIGSLTYTPLKEREPDDLTDEECGTLLGVERSDRFDASPNLLRSIAPTEPYRFPDDDPVVLTSQFYVERERELSSELEQTKQDCLRNNDLSRWNDALDKYCEDLAELELEARSNIRIPILNDTERAVWESLQCECARLLTSENRQRGRNALAVAMRSREADEHASSELPSLPVPTKKSLVTAEKSRQLNEPNDQSTSDKQTARPPDSDKLIDKWLEEGNAIPPGKGLNGLALKLVNFLLGEESWTATIDASQCHLELEDKETKDGHRLRPLQREIHQFFGKNSAYSIGFSLGYVELKRKKK